MAAPDGNERRDSGSAYFIECRLVSDSSGLIRYSVATRAEESPVPSGLPPALANREKAGTTLRSNDGFETHRVHARPAPVSERCAPVAAVPATSRTSAKFLP